MARDVDHYLTWVYHSMAESMLDVPEPTLRDVEIGTSDGDNSLAGTLTQARQLFDVKSAASDADYSLAGALTQSRQRVST